MKSLKEICSGKMYVESESAKLHFMLSKMYEDKGDLDAACEIIQDVHVETYGSLSKKEKAEYILEQIRLNLLKKDYIRALIHSRKMNPKTIEEAGFETVKITFYRMMIEYYMVEKNTWEIAQAYYKIASTPFVPSGPTIDPVDGAVEMKGESDSRYTHFPHAHSLLLTHTYATYYIYSSVAEAEAFKTQRREALEGAIIFLLMSKHDNHQNDMLHRVKKQLAVAEFKDLASSLHSVYTSAVALFTTKEIIPNPFPDQGILESHPSLFYPNPNSPLAKEIAAQLSKTLQDRIIQHNLRVVGAYYKRIRTERLCQLLGLSPFELEAHLSEMSSDGQLYLKIDRPVGIVDFMEKKMPEQVR